MANMQVCKICGKPLKKTQFSKDMKLKSCPCCSQANGKQHIFYERKEFSFSKKRITKNSPDGDQSYCTSCRSGADPNINKGILCENVQR